MNSYTILSLHEEWCKQQMNCEVLYTSEASGQLWNVSVWDPVTGTSLCTYKGSSSGPRTLCLLGNDYLLSAVNSKPLVHLWLLQKREQIHQRLVVPGRVSALALSPDGLYCVAAIQELLHVWQVSTGNLLAVLARHYQSVTCIRFTDDGSHFVSAGADNLVLAWSFARVVDASGSTSREARHTWSDHSLPVSDVYVGHGGVRARVFTSSLDHTCKVYELCSGRLLVNLVFDCAMTSLVVDKAGHRLFAGGANGTIYQVDLYTSPVKTERHFSGQDDAEAPIFTGHTKQVTCLALSMDGALLVSGSHDCSVNLWDVASRQCVRTIPHKGAVTNVLLSHVRPVMENTGQKHLQPFQAFRRHLYDTEDSASNDGADTGSVNVLLNRTQWESEGSEEETEDFKQYVKQVETKLQDNDSMTSSLQERVQQLKTINKQLYDFAVGNVVDGPHEKPP